MVLAKQFQLGVEFIDAILVRFVCYPAYFSQKLQMWLENEEEHISEAHSAALCFLKSPLGVCFPFVSVGGRGGSTVASGCGTWSGTDVFTQQELLDSFAIPLLYVVKFRFRL